MSEPVRQSYKARPAEAAVTLYVRDGGVGEKNTKKISAFIEAAIEATQPGGKGLDAFLNPYLQPDYETGIESARVDLGLRQLARLFNEIDPRRFRQEDPVMEQADGSSLNTKFKVFAFDTSGLRGHDVEQLKVLTEAYYPKDRALHRVIVDRYYEGQSELLREVLGAQLPEPRLQVA